MSEENNTPRLTDEDVKAKVIKLGHLQQRLEQGEKKKGFRSISKKDKEKIESQIQETAQEIATEYLARYNSLCEMFGMEVRAVMQVNPYQPNVAQARTELRPYKPAAKPQTKPWHEAMADNLHTRAKCEHLLHDEGLTCEKCGLPPDKWGKDNKGVSAEYHEEAKAKIEAEKQKHEQEEKAE